MDSIKYDVIIPLAKKDVNFVHWVVTYIRNNFEDAQSIYIITNKSLFTKLKRLVDKETCILIDENEMLKGLSFSSIRKIVLANNQRAGITGHYFQQFLKMGFSLTPYCKEYYLTWDSDTIPLSKISFFQNGHPLFSLKKEFRERYFEVLMQVLGIEKQIEGSFIAEHMIFKSSIMKEMLAKIEERAEGMTWYEAMVNCTDKTRIDENIISEFEIYGNYCLANYPNLYDFHELRALRHAGIIRGRLINKRILRMLAYDIDLATFEKYDSPYSLLHFKSQLKRLNDVFRNNKVSEWPVIISKILHNESLKGY